MDTLQLVFLLFTKMEPVVVLVFRFVNALVTMYLFVAMLFFVVEFSFD